MSWGFSRDASPIWNSIWNWHRGAAGGDHQQPNAKPNLRKSLSASVKHLALNAAYNLAASDEEGCEELFQRWPEEAANKLESNLSGRYRNPGELLSSHGLTAAAEKSVRRLDEALTDQNRWIRASAADRMGDVGLPARGSIPALLKALQDESEWDRRNAALSLGVVDDDGISAVELGRHLDDTANRVAQNASLALCKMALHLQAAQSDLNRALDSQVNYVKANSQLALKIMETGSVQA